MLRSVVSGSDGVSLDEVSLSRQRSLIVSFIRHFQVLVDTQWARTKYQSDLSDAQAQPLKKGI